MFSHNLYSKRRLFVICLIYLFLPATIWCFQNYNRTYEVPASGNPNKGRFGFTANSNTNAKQNLNSINPYLKEYLKNYNQNNNSPYRSGTGLPPITYQERRRFDKYAKTSLTDIWQNYKGIIIPILIFFLLGAIIQIIEDFGKQLLRGILIILLVSAVLGGAFLILWFLGIISIFLIEEITATNALPVLCFSVILVGSIFYIFRLQKKTLYGLFEIISGILICAFTVLNVSGYGPKTGEVFTHQNRYALIAGLFSSVYIVVRGLDNVGEENLKSFGKKLRNILRLIPKRQTTKNEKED